MTGNRRIRTTCAWSISSVVVLVALLGAPAASGDAAGPAPQYDPQSPAGKEYALPLSQARRQAGAEPSEERGATTAAATVDEGALFGAGIAPAAKPRSGSSNAPSSRSADGEEQAPAAGPNASTGPPGAKQASGSKSESSEVSASVVGVLSGCAVLFLAMLLTLVIRTRPRSSNTAGAPG